MLSKKESHIQGFIIDKLIEYNKSLNVQKISEDSRLFEDGIIDSISFVELILDIQKNYHIEIEPEEINESNFTSIDSLSHFIITKLS